MLKIETTKKEWLVATEGQVSVCVGVTNGQVTEIKVNGAFGGEGCQSVWFQENRLPVAAQLRDALNTALGQVMGAMERTAPEAAKEEG